MKNINLSVRYLLIASLSTLFLIACSNDRIVYSYVVVKPTVEDSMVNEWRPVMRVAYQVSENTVISEVAGLLDEYKDCSIKNINNWVRIHLVLMMADIGKHQVGVVMSGMFRVGNIT